MTTLVITLLVLVLLLIAVIINLYQRLRVLEDYTDMEFRAHYAPDPDVQAEIERFVDSTREALGKEE